MNYDVGVFTRRRIISPAESYFAAPPPGVAPYVGLGDTAAGAGALAYWGFNAYTAAGAASGTVKCCNMTNVITSANSDFYFTSNGFPDVDLINTFLTGGTQTGVIMTLYDQVGTNHMAVLGTQANAALYVRSTTATNKPGMLLQSVNSGKYSTANLLSNALDQTGPYNFSVVARGEDATDAIAAFLAGGSVYFEVITHLGTGWYVIGVTECPTNPAGNAAINAFHAGAFSFNPSSSSAASVKIDSGTDTGGTTGSPTYGANPVAYMGHDGFNSYLDGTICAVGIWSRTALWSGTDRANINANQHTNWGF